MQKTAFEFRKYIRWFWGIIAGFILFMFLFFILLSSGVIGFMPSFEELENPRNVLASEMISADGKILDNYFIRENRSYVDHREIPQHLIEALIAVEDERFYRHSGIDFRGLIRVVKGIILMDSNAGGGSTISQQLAKMLFPRDVQLNKFELVARKFKEWIIAVKLERSYTKEEIILMYLNKYDYLNNAVGIKSAAQVYFSVPPDSLQIHQSAMLVGMAKNSSLYNPVRRPELVLERRNVVLNQMEKNGYITKAQRDSMKQLPLDLKYSKVDYKIGPAPYLREYLRLVLNAKKPDPDKYTSTQNLLEDQLEWDTNPLYGWCNKNLKANGEPYDIYTDGLKIYTTIDSRMQKYAVEAVEQHLRGEIQPLFDSSISDMRNPPFANNMSSEETEALLERAMKQTERYRLLKLAGKDMNQIKANFNQPVDMTVFSWRGAIDTTMSPIDSIKWYLRFFRSSFMAMEPESGKVKAYVGGPNYVYFMYDMVKMGKRQVGSTVKPFLYTLAMQNGYTPCTKVPYVNQQFVQPDGSIYEPKDSERDDEMEGKMVTLKWGLANSKNRISAWVMKQFSPEAVVEVMKRLGVVSYIDPVNSMFLGTSDVTLYEMVGAFNTYNNLGVYVKPYFVTRIEDRYGNVIASFLPERREAIDEQTAYLMLNLLQAVINEGTGGRLRGPRPYGQFRMPIAGKTGTTQNHSDGWFIGATPALTAGVWTGADLRSIHFRSLQSGQGANLALPVWGWFYKKVLADSTLGITEDMQFKTPEYFNINLNCDDQDLKKTKAEEDEFF